MLKKKLVLYISIPLLILAIIALSFYGVASKYSARHVALTYYQNLLKTKYDLCYDKLSPLMRDNLGKDAILENYKNKFGNTPTDYSDLKISSSQELSNGLVIVYVEYNDKTKNEDNSERLIMHADEKIFGFINKFYVLDTSLNNK